MPGQDASGTEDKLALLSMIDGLGGCTEEQLMRFALDAGLMGQFRFLLALGDLREQGFVREAVHGEGRVLLLTPEGRETLTLFGKDLPPSVQAKLSANISAWKGPLREERQLPAEWERTDEGFRVRLRALEAGQEMLSIELAAATREEARAWCARWPSAAPEIYGTMMRCLTQADAKPNER